MIVDFRFDASHQIGGGHAYRSVALSRWLRARGHSCRFILNREAINVLPFLRTEGVDLFVVSDDQSIEIEQIVSMAPSDIFVIDHYGKDESFERAVKRDGTLLVSVDDIPGRKHNVDLLIDPTYGREVRDYCSLIHADCKVLCGSQFAVLRKEFSQLRSRRRRAVVCRLKRMLILAGSLDPNRLIPWFLNAVETSFPSCSVDIVVGGACQHLDEVRLSAEKSPCSVSLHVDAENVAELMSSADLVLGAAGSSVWEICSIGGASIVKVIASNQVDIAKVLQENQAAYVLSDDPENGKSELESILRKLSENPGHLERIRLNAAKMCDGLGGERLVAFFETVMLERSENKVTIRPIREEDVEIVYNWQIEPGMRSYFRNPKSPTWREHVKWFDLRLKSYPDMTYIAELNNVPAGLIHLYPLEDNVFEVSILVSRQMQGKRVASEGLSQLLDIHAENTLTAVVSAKNVASLRLFKSKGFVPSAGNNVLVRKPVSQ
ncbi:MULTISPECIES: UDP-2,4-diacetamido-2,4,6-trideoxy-beta-L-altropyranose hydrolase [Thalassospira]|uniref:N-acetyltransferase domain-containing protein n=2 Tax=Thalassospira TaxID=168934 RepID=A0A367WBQ1_9PROT|nr:MULTISPECIES: UDP-2,4-diacetamido-2,4,6-trideoxy-beta-L-altropyranose hydrolase [Thalassospira]MDG4717675.1 UDP-2,4-diacetamido-2,4,6-trideoxy-beta-L-altropyranose hydrolase [Thalassospira sp. FZY0004]RCK38866.1 hypothetical protein TH19_03445 [Thalassospira profundimaris]